MEHNIRVLRDAVKKVARALSDQDIKVTQMGTRAFCEFNDRTKEVERVNLPMLPDNASRELCEALQGFLDHEVGHLLFTDWAALIKLQTKLRREKHPHAKSVMEIANILEDPRIEQCMRKKFRGSGSNIRTVMDFVFDEEVEPRLKKAKEMAAVNPMAAASILTMPVIRELCGCPNARRYMEDPERRELAKDLYEALEPMKGELTKMRSTGDVCRVSAEVIDALSKFIPPRPPEDGSGGDSEPGEDSKQSEGGGKADKSKANPDGDDSESSSTESETESESSEGKTSDESSAPKKEDENSKANGSEDSDEESGSGDSEEPEDASSEADDGEDSEQAENEEKPAEESESESESESEKDEDESDGEGDGEGSTDGVGNIDSGEEGSSGESEEEVEEEDSLLEQIISQEQPPFKDLDEMCSDSISRKIGELVGDDSFSEYMPFSRDADNISIWPLTDCPSYNFDNFELRAKETSNVLQVELERIMVARSASVWNSGLRRGRLNPSALHRLRFGDDRVFRKRVESKSKDIAISMLIDLSGSMHGSKLDLAMLSANIFGNVLKRIGVPFEILGFTTDHGAGAGRYSHPDCEKIRRDFQTARAEGKHAGIQGKFARWEPLLMPIFKDWHEVFNDEQKKRMVNFPIQGYTANNIDGECVEIAAGRLMMRRENQKVLIVLSDGYPSCAPGSWGAGSRSSGPFGARLQNRHLKDVVKKVSASGIDVFGIGIEDSAVSSFYPKHAVLHSVSGLPAIVIGAMRDALLK